MSLIKHLKRPAVGAKAGGMYADGLVPQQPVNGIGLGAAGYSKMLYNIQNGIDPTKPAAATQPGAALAATPTQASAPAATQPQPVQPPAPAAPSAPAQPKGLSISNGMDSGGGLQITNGFDSPAPTAPAPAAPAPQAAAPAAPQQPAQQPQKFARGRVPNALINGIVRGEGGPTEDKVPAKVSPDEAILPAKTVQALGGPAAIKALIECTNDGQPPESEVQGGGKYADGAVPGFFDDLSNALARPDTGLRQDVNAVQRAFGDFSGVSRRMPDVPAEDAAAYAAQPASAAAPRPLVADAKQEPAPAPVATSSPAPAQAMQATQSPRQSPAPVPLIAAAPYRNTPDAPPEMRGADYANQQLANIRGYDEGGPKVAVIADPAAQERRAFDNFVTRSNGEAAYRDAIRSGKPQNIQAAGNTLANLTQVGDQQEQKAGEFQRGMDALATKSQFDREAENNRGRIGLAQAALQGKNALASETMRGNNALITEAMRGTNALAVADRNAVAQQAAREYMNPLDAQLKQAQISDANVKASLRDKILNASPEDQAALARQVAAMDGRYADKDSAEMAKARMGLIGDAIKAYNGPMGAPLGPDKTPIPIDQYVDQVLRASGVGGSQPQKQQTPGAVSTGQVINGYRFKGGDPSKQSSWEKA